jgi:predicted  nucleic acid-binding Zn-ribbon protein
MASNDIKKTKEEMKKMKNELFSIFMELKDVRKEVINHILGISRRRERRSRILSRLGLKKEVYNK